MVGFSLSSSFLLVFSPSSTLFSSFDSAFWYGVSLESEEEECDGNKISSTLSTHTQNIFFSFAFGSSSSFASYLSSSDSTLYLFFAGRSLCRLLASGNFSLQIWSYASTRPHTRIAFYVLDNA